MHILFIDDDWRDVELAQSALAKSGLPVVFAYAPDEIQAMDYLTCRGHHEGRPPEAPAVIFLDLKLDDTRGTDLIAGVRAIPGLAHIPIVMLTTSNDQGDIRECYRRGANAYLAKPIAYGEFAELFVNAVRFWAMTNTRPR
jgi:CheY-like chemotaxis protein